MKTQIQSIVDYWKKNCIIPESELNFDWSDANTHCWNCGDCKLSSNGIVGLERAHIIPEILGGKDIPENYVLLCNKCHSDAPNINNHNDMWIWIKSNTLNISYYNTYRFNQVLKLYEEKEKSILIDEIDNLDNFFIQFKEGFKLINRHGFDKYNVNTLYFLLKNLKNNFNI